MYMCSDWNFEGVDEHDFDFSNAILCDIWANEQDYECWWINLNFFR